MKINNPLKPKFPHVVNTSKELITYKNYLENIGLYRMSIYGILEYRTDFDLALYPLIFVATGPKSFTIIREH